MPLLLHNFCLETGNFDWCYILTTKINWKQKKTDNDGISSKFFLLHLYYEKLWYVHQTFNCRIMPIWEVTNSRHNFLSVTSHMTDQNMPVIVIVSKLNFIFKSKSKREQQNNCRSQQPKTTAHSKVNVLILLFIQ